MDKQTLSATLITGFSHTLSTVIIGIIVGFIGYQLSEHYKNSTEIIAPAILILIGIIYLILDAKSSHHHHIEDKSLNKNKSKLAIIISLSVAMFLTPCFEIEAYYFQVATIGWFGIIIVSLVHVFTTLILYVIISLFRNKRC